MQYTVLVYEDPGKQLAEFPVVHGAHSWGYSPEDALELVLEVLRLDGKALPKGMQTMRVEVNAA